MKTDRHQDQYASAAKAVTAIFESGCRNGSGEQGTGEDDRLEHVGIELPTSLP